MIADKSKYRELSYGWEFVIKPNSPYSPPVKELKDDAAIRRVMNLILEDISELRLYLETERPDDDDEAAQWYDKLTRNIGVLSNLPPDEDKAYFIAYELQNRNIIISAYNYLFDYLTECNARLAVLTGNSIPLPNRVNYEFVKIPPPDITLQWQKFANSLPKTFKSLAALMEHCSVFTDILHKAANMRDVLATAESYYPTAVEYRAAARSYAQQFTYLRETALEFLQIFDDYIRRTDVLRKWVEREAAYFESIAQRTTQTQGNSTGSPANKPGAPTVESPKMKQSTAARIGLNLMERGELLHSWNKTQVADLLTKCFRNENGEKFNNLYNSMKSGTVKTTLTAKEQISLGQIKAIIEVAINTP